MKRLVTGAVALCVVLTSVVTAGAWAAKPDSGRAAAHSRSTLRAYEPTGAWILRLSPEARRTDIERRSRTSGGRVMFWLPELSIAVVTGVSASDAGRWLGIESVVPDIGLALPDLRAPRQQTTQTSGPLGVNSPIAQQQWNLRQIRSDVASAGGHTGQDVVVAVIDTGIFADHPDLAGNVLVDRGTNTYAPYVTCAGTPLGEPPDDPSLRSECPALDTLANPLTAGDPDNTFDDVGHGTFMSGIIAAHGGEQGTGVVGVAPGAKLLPIRVCSSEGVCPLGAIAAGIVHAVDQGATIANLSLRLLRRIDRAGCLVLRHHERLPGLRV